MTSSPLLLILNSVMCSKLLKSSFLELEIASWLRALDDLPEDLGSTPSTHNAVYNYNSSSGRSDALFCPLREPGTQVVQIYLGKYQSTKQQQQKSLFISTRTNSCYTILRHTQHNFPCLQPRKSHSRGTVLESRGLCRLHY